MNFLQFLWDFTSKNFQLNSPADQSKNNVFKIFVRRIHNSPTEKCPDAIHFQAFVNIPYRSPPVNVDVPQHHEHVLVISTNFRLNHDLDDVEWVENGWDEGADDCAREELMCVFVQDTVLNGDGGGKKK